MSCGTLGDNSQEQGSRATQSPGASGSAIVKPMTGSGLTLQDRQRLWARTALCPLCGGRSSLQGTCNLCNGSGNVSWDNEEIPARDLAGVVIGAAERELESPDGYLWLVSHFPELVRHPAVQNLIRQELTQHPERAMYGYAPDTLRQAGMTMLLVNAARKCPDAARASLRAQKVLEGSK